MKKNKFKKMSEGRPREIKVGEFFLEGHAMIGQKDKKIVGDMISYFEVIRVHDDKHYEYSHKFDRLEED